MIDNIRESNPELRREIMKLRLKKLNFDFKSISTKHKKTKNNEDFFDFTNVMKNFPKTCIKTKQEPNKINKNYQSYKSKHDEIKEEKIKSQLNKENSATKHSAKLIEI